MSSEKKKELQVSFDITTIDHLGVKLYSTIPPMIAELVSNAWDADAHIVKIHFNENGAQSISVQDDGLGMSFDELNTKFLKIGRNRRIESGSDKTPSFRPVLGKKGLGKLSMFGIGKKITISTVKNGLKNTFVMDYDEIKGLDNKEYYKPRIIECDQQTSEANGTLILIEELAKKSGFDVAAYRQGLLSRFRIFSSDFVVEINDDDSLKIDKNVYDSEKSQFSWTFPKDYQNDCHEFAELYNFACANKIKGSIYTAATPLTKDKQGIILFSRGKLVQENKAFSERGNDNFFQYMAGEFTVDFVDAALDVDNCSTDRKSLAWDTYCNDDLVKLKIFMERIVAITQKKWRLQRKEDKEKKLNETGIEIKLWLDSLSQVEQPLAKKLVDAILGNDDISKEAAASYIVCIKDMYSFTGFQSFTKKLESMNALDSENAIKLLTDWSEIEAKEYAKISLGRIKTIEQFDKYIRENASETKVIQKFLEEFPWLLDPKMSKFEREKTYSKILKERFDDSKLDIPNRRIDFLCTNSSGIVHIIELKRPNIKITRDELNQITDYVDFIEKQFPGNVKEVKGYLISNNMEIDSNVEKTRKGLESQNIFVKSYSDLLAEARRYNNELYALYDNIANAKMDNKQSQ